MEKRILEIIGVNKTGITITELVTISRLSRSKIRTLLARLEGADKINFRKIGMAKVYYLKDRKGGNNEGF